MNINEFKSSFDQGGFTRPSNFQAYVFRPGSTDPSVSREMSFRISNVNLPSRTINTSDYFYYGLPYRIGYSSSFADVNIGIYLSEDLKERDYFEDWVDIIIGNYRSSNSLSPESYNIGYYDDYVGTLIVQNYTDDGQIYHDLEIIQCYPTAIGEIAMDWADNNPLRLDVTFAFHHYKRIQQ